MIELSLFQLVTILKSQNTYERDILSELWHINLYTNIRITNWHIWSIDPKIMKYLTPFHFDTRLLTSKHSKHFSTYIVERNGAMWKTCFSAPQNAKKEHQLKHKNQVRYWSLIELGLRVWKIILVNRDWIQISQTVNLISIKRYRNWKTIVYT